MTSAQPDSPLSLSVVVCTYNGGAYLGEQLDSLLAQTLRPTEIIIHDDGSSDNTLTIARQYAERAASSNDGENYRRTKENYPADSFNKSADSFNYSADSKTHPAGSPPLKGSGERGSAPTIRVVRNTGEHGVNGNFFAALRAAQGSLIAICDQDDIWEPAKLEKQVACIRRTGALLCGCISRPFSADGSPVSADLRPANLAPLRMMYVGVMPGHTLLLRRELLDCVPNGRFFMYDLQLQMSAALRQSLCLVPEVLVHQRRHTAAATYMRPQSRWQILTQGLRTFSLLRPEVRRRFAQWEAFLGHPALQQSPLRPAALQMARLQQGRGLCNYLRLTLFCLRHRRELMPSPQIKGLRAVCYALAFPFTCVNYYRYFLTRQ